MFNTFEGRRVNLQGILARYLLDLFRQPAAPHGLQDHLGRRVQPGGLVSGLGGAILLVGDPAPDEG